MAMFSAAMPGLENLKTVEVVAWRGRIAALASEARDRVSMRENEKRILEVVFVRSG